jgi:hypothetical protein
MSKLLLGLNGIGGFLDLSRSGCNQLIIEPNRMVSLFFVVNDKFYEYHSRYSQ